MDLKAATTELETTSARYRAILDEFKDKAVPAEKQAELDRLYTRAMELKTSIDAEVQTTTRRTDMDGIKSFLERPAATIPHPSAVNADADGRKVLQARGWEIKSNALFAPTSTGKLVEMYPEAVVFGTLPTGDAEEEIKAAAYMRQTRAIFQPEYKAAYDHFLRSAVRYRSEAMAFASLPGIEQKALAAGQDDTGGFLVPPDYQAELLVRLGQFALMRRFARVQPTSRDQLRWPRVQANATSGSIYSSGFVGDWAGETPVFTDVDPKFGLFIVPIKKVRVATKLANDFIADSAVDIVAWLARNGAENMALVEDKGFIAGDGAALQPKGIVNSGAATVDIEGSTADTISNTTAAQGSAPKLVDLIYALPSQYLPNARTVMRRSTEGKVRKLVDGQGRFHWPATGFGATPRELLGYPVENNEFVDADGTNTNKPVIFGDLGSYVIAQRTGISTVILRERFADTDQTGIVIFERVGGDTWNEDALRFGIV